MSRYSFPPTPENWNHIKDAVKSYYVNQKLPLKEVRTVLRDRHGFRATDRMIKARLKQWGFLKNAKRDDWLFLALLYENRRERGMRSTVFDVRGHRKTPKDLQRFIRNQNMTAEQFLAEARIAAGAKEVPEYIQALTPDSKHYQDSPDDIEQDYFTPSPPLSSARLPYHSDGVMTQSDIQTGRPTNHQRPRTTSTASYTHDTGMFSDTNGEFQQQTGMQDSAYMSAMTSSNTSACTQMQVEFEMLGSQLVRPAPLVSRIGDEDISSWALVSSSPSSSEESSRSIQFICSRCHQPSDQHFISLDSFEPLQAVRRDILNGDDHTLHLPVSTREEGSWLWVSRCFLACICLRKGDTSAADRCLDEAAKEFERLLERKDRQLLTAAGLVMTVLHMHDQGDIAKRVIDSAQAVTARVLAQDHPIAITIRYLTASATISFTECGITSDLLETVCQKFLDYYPPDHEYVIAARYNYSWMLKFEGKLEEAEREAREVYVLSCRTLGKIHMQSVTCLAVIAGCISPNQQRTDECIAIFDQVIKQASISLGRHHPYTLEAKRRMAEKIIEISGSSFETLALFKDVLWGRVHMLGPVHPFTQGAKDRYAEELQTMNLWVNQDGQPSYARCELEELFSPKSPGSWTKISRRRTSSQQTLQRPLKRDLEEDDMVDDDCEEVLVEVKTGSQSPRSNHEFEAY